MPAMTSANILDWISVVRIGTMTKSYLNVSTCHVKHLSVNVAVDTGIRLQTAASPSRDTIRTDDSSDAAPSAMPAAQPFPEIKFGSGWYRNHF